MALSQAAVCLMNNMTSAFEFNCNPVTNVQVADCPAPEFEDATAGYTELRSRRDAIPGGAAQRPPQTLDRARLIKDAADLEVEVLKEDTGPARLLLSGRTASHRCGREGVRARMDLNSAAIPILVCPPEATGCATSTRGRAAISGRPRHLHDPVEPRARRFSDSNRPDAAVAVVCSVSE
jgi:hypothetical protein